MIDPKLAKILDSIQTNPHSDLIQLTKISEFLWKTNGLLVNVNPVNLIKDEDAFPAFFYSLSKRINGKLCTVKDSSEDYETQEQAYQAALLEAINWEYYKFPIETSDGKTLLIEQFIKDHE